MRTVQLSAQGEETSGSLLRKSLVADHPRWRERLAALALIADGWSAKAVARQGVRRFTPGPCAPDPPPCESQPPLRQESSAPHLDDPQWRHHPAPLLSESFLTDDFPVSYNSVALRLCRRLTWFLASHPTRSTTVKKRNASLSPSLERPALPVLPAQSRHLVRPNC
jgi:hypothetical protein